jgi:hypothetical protein
MRDRILTLGRCGGLARRQRVAASPGASTGFATGITLGRLARPPFERKSRNHDHAARAGGRHPEVTPGQVGFIVPLVFLLAFAQTFARDRAVYSLLLCVNNTKSIAQQISRYPRR